jgi:Asp-tRNA(Asn)/Glu-tRNA(Gln) amidotransferase B subunit
MALSALAGREALKRTGSVSGVHVTLDTKLQGFFLGQLMKRTGGLTDPKLANRILSEQLKG